jgi:hypothetical protein
MPKTFTIPRKALPMYSIHQEFSCILLTTFFACIKGTSERNEWINFQLIFRKWSISSLMPTLDDNPYGNANDS